MKKIEDYLHYYIGQKCQCFWKSPITGQLEYERDGKIVGIDFDAGKDTYPVMVKTPVRPDSEFTTRLNYSFEEIMPILRPLSDMTEEELIGCLKTVSLIELTGAVFDCQLPSDEDCNGEVFINAIMGFGGSVVDYYVLDINGLKIEPEVFHYLLSRGFDLFGLIEAGLAIDSKTLAP